MKFSKGGSSWILSKLRTFPGRCFSEKLFQARSFLVLWKEKNDFKRKKLKRAKNGQFPKWSVHRFRPKIEPDIFCVFYGNYARKDRFSVFWIKNNYFKTKQFSKMG